jgi:hypothetical protein
LTANGKRHNVIQLLLSASAYGIPTSRINLNLMPFLYTIASLAESSASIHNTGGIIH